MYDLPDLTMEDLIDRQAALKAERAEVVELLVALESDAARFQDRKSPRLESLLSRIERLHERRAVITDNIRTLKREMAARHAANKSLKDARPRRSRVFPAIRRLCEEIARDVNTSHAVANAAADLALLIEEEE